MADETNAAVAMKRLLEIMDRLRDPGGCPWDREQTLRSLTPYLLEEAHEVIEAIEAGDAAHHREELGDLLFQVVFQARIAREEGKFDFADVCDAIADAAVDPAVPASRVPGEVRRTAQDDAAQPSPLQQIEDPRASCLAAF